MIERCIEFWNTNRSVAQSVLFYPTFVAALIVYAFFSLFPFDLDVPEFIDNGAEFLPDGSLRFQSPGIAISKKAPDWVLTAIEENQWSITTQLRSFQSDQRGPARLMALSFNYYHRNLTVMQHGRDLHVRVRTKTPYGLGWPGVKIPDVFQSNRWIELTIRGGPERLEVTIDNGRPVGRDLPPQPFSVWDPAYRLHLGNEATFNRPWLGEFRTLKITTPDGIIDGLDPAALDRPPRYLFLRNYPKLVPFRDFSVKDARENFLMYIPMGTLLGFWVLIARKKPLVFAMILTSGISLGFEITQFFVTIRNPSVDDLLFNSLGGAFGVLSAGLLVWLSGRYLNFKSL